MAAGLPCASASLVTLRPPTAVPASSKSQANGEASKINNIAALAIQQLATGHAFESPIQQDAGKTLSGPGGLSPLATVAPSTQEVRSAVATDPPKPQPKTGLNATDSALLWMVQQLDSRKTLDLSVGSLSAKRKSALIPDISAALFAQVNEPWGEDFIQ